jgi:hypothetical protein
MSDEKDFEAFDNSEFALNVSSKESLFLVTLPSDVDISTLKGLKINLQQDEDKVVKTSKNKELRMTKEMASEMDSSFRALACDRQNRRLMLAPAFSGVIKFTHAIPKLSPMTIEEVNGLKVCSFISDSVELQTIIYISVQIDHPYSKMPQLPDLKVHATPIGSLSTVEEVNKRNKRKAHHSVDQTPKKTSKSSHEAAPLTEVKSDKKKEKKEKKDKKDKK